MDCRSCLSKYDSSKKRPMALLCGHSLCKDCCNKVKIKGRIKCPECEDTTTTKPVENNTLLTFIQVLSEKCDIDKVTKSCKQSRACRSCTGLFCEPCLTKHVHMACDKTFDGYTYEMNLLNDINSYSCLRNIVEIHHEGLEKCVDQLSTYLETWSLRLCDFLSRLSSWNEINASHIEFCDEILKFDTNKAECKNESVAWEQKMTSMNSKRSEQDLPWEVVINSLKSYLHLFGFTQLFKETVVQFEMPKGPRNSLIVSHEMDTITLTGPVKESTEISYDIDTDDYIYQLITNPLNVQSFMITLTSGESRKIQWNFHFDQPKNGFMGLLVKAVLSSDYKIKLCYKKNKNLDLSFMSEGEEISYILTATETGVHLLTKDNQFMCLCKTPDGKHIRSSEWKSYLRDQKLSQFKIYLSCLR